MRWLLFLSRLAFICGLFFVLSITLLFYSWTTDEDLAGYIITIGFFMGMIIVPITMVCYLAVALSRKKLRTIVPRWIIIANILFLLLLLGYLYYVNHYL